jgi:hypothetical protein
MPMLFKTENVIEVDSDRSTDEASGELFDRAAFARRAIDLVDPRHTTVVICEGASRMRVESGRIWGRPRGRWALLAIPNRASRRAIAVAVAQLADGSRAYALDVLMDEARDSAESAPPLA